MIPQAYYAKAAKLAEEYPGLDPEKLTYSGCFSCEADELPPSMQSLASGKSVMISFMFTKWEAAIWLGSRRFWAGTDDDQADQIWEALVKPHVFETAEPVFQFFQSIPVDDQTIDLVELLEAGC